jgi:preprotein translocase subunit SecF
MNFFKQVDLDWMGKAKYFFGLSLTLLLVGAASLIAHGGPYYGIDFKGGTVVDVRFATPPPVDTIRNGLTQQGMSNFTIVPVSDIASPNSNEVLINLEEKGEGAEALDAGKTAILNALHTTLGMGEAGKQDFNAVGPSAISDVLTQKDPLALGSGAGDRYNQLARQLADFRDKDRRGVLTNLQSLHNGGVSGLSFASDGRWIAYIHTVGFRSAPRVAPVGFAGD